MAKSKKKKTMRKFSTGATRDNDSQKLNYIGSLSPLVLKRFTQFMRDHNIKDGKLKRDEANWKKGMPLQSYIESKMRHYMDFWIEHEGYGEADIEEFIEMLCGDLFNTMGYLHTLLVEQLKKKVKKPAMTAAKALTKIINAYGLKAQDVMSIFKRNLRKKIKN